MLRITELSLPLDHPPEALEALVRQRLRLKAAEPLSYTVFKRSYDARKKNGEMTFVYTVDCTVADEAALLKRHAGDRQIGLTPDLAYHPVALAPSWWSCRWCR